MNQLINVNKESVKAIPELITTDGFITDMKIFFDKLIDKASAVDQYHAEIYKDEYGIEHFTLHVKAKRV